MATRKVMTGTCPHGKILFAAVNEPSNLAFFAQDIARMLGEGCNFEIVDGPVTLGGNCRECELAEEKV